jgi:acetyl esterase/lipase
MSRPPREQRVRTVRLMLDMLARGRTIRYGPHRSQCADLYLPCGPGPHPVMVVLHGGSWQKRYGRAVMRGLVGDLVRRGWAVWNVEYRRVGEGGGWPATFADVAAAIDHLGELDAPLELDAVSVLGHSAGGHLALWAASRGKLPPDAPGAQPAVALRRAIALAGVCDLAGAHRRWHGGAAQLLMEGSPEELPERYALADPLALAPLEIPVLLVHGSRDETVSIELSYSYQQGASAAGGRVELIEVLGDAGRHRAFLNPRGEAWRTTASRLREPVAAS